VEVDPARVLRARAASWARALTGRPGVVRLVESQREARPARELARLEEVLGVRTRDLIFLVFYGGDNEASGQNAIFIAAKTFWALGAEKPIVAELSLRYLRYDQGATTALSQPLSDHPNPTVRGL